MTATSRVAARIRVGSAGGLTLRTAILIPGWTAIAVVVLGWPAAATAAPPATGVSRLRVGGRRTVRVAQKASCVDQVAGTKGDPSGCTLSAIADVIVRRTS